MRLSYSLFGVLCVASAACSSTSPGDIQSDPSPSTESDAGADAAIGDGDGDGDGDTGDGDGDGDTGDGDAPGDGDADGGFMECAASRVEAERKLRPVDIVWVIDSSGSMDQEANYVQTNLNNFAAQIGNAGIEDYRVVVITTSAFVTVPDPLGSDSEHYLFIEEEVESEAPLMDLLSRFDDYAGFLQPEAITHFVVVTDDESDLPANDFLMQMRTRLGKDFFVHAIASEAVQKCVDIPIIGQVCSDTPCGEFLGQQAAGIGVEHYAAAMQSGGLTFSICTQDWTALFSTLGEQVSVSAPIPCELLVPESPDGKALDPDKVNVVFTPQGSTMGTPIPRVSDSAACGTTSAWHYDSPVNPEKIVLCPTACTTAEGGGALDIALGCATVVVR